MKRKLVQAGASLAVTLPAEVVQQFHLEKGMVVDVSVHPRTGAVIIRRRAGGNTVVCVDHVSSLGDASEQP